MPIDPETYLVHKFFGQLVPAGQTKARWLDGSVTRSVHICPLSVQITDELKEILDKSGVYVTYSADGGSWLPSLHGQSQMNEEYKIIATVKDNPVLGRFRRVFDRLVMLQPTPNRLRVAEGPVSVYNEEIRSFAAEWTVRVKT